MSRRVAVIPIVRGAHRRMKNVSTTPHILLLRKFCETFLVYLALSCTVGLVLILIGQWHYSPYFIASLFFLWIYNLVISAILTVGLYLLVHDIWKAREIMKQIVERSTMQSIEVLEFSRLRKEIDVLSTNNYWTNFLAIAFAFAGLLSIIVLSYIINYCGVYYFVGHVMVNVQEVAFLVIIFREAMVVNELSDSFTRSLSETAADWQSEPQRISLLVESSFNPISFRVLNIRLTKNNAVFQVGAVIGSLLIGFTKSLVEAF